MKTALLVIGAVFCAAVFFMLVFGPLFKAIGRDNGEE